MSTKIMKGRRLYAGQDLFTFTAELREIMLPVRRRLDAEMIINKAVEIYDEQALTGSGIDGDHSAVSVAIKEFFNSQREADRNHVEHDPNRFEASFGLDELTGHLMMLPHCEQDAFMTALDEHPSVEEYSYWNNVECRPGIPRLEWDARRDAWDRVIGTGVPSDTMLRFTLYPSSTLSVIEVFTYHDEGHDPAVLAAVENVPSAEKRAFKLLRRRGFDLGLYNPATDRLSEKLHLIDSAASKLASKLSDQLEEITVEKLYQPHRAVSISGDFDTMIKEHITTED